MKHTVYLCDRCKAQVSEAGLNLIVIDGEKYELCNRCLEALKDWLRPKASQSPSYTSVSEGKF